MLVYHLLDMKQYKPASIGQVQAISSSGPRSEQYERDDSGDHLDHVPGPEAGRAAHRDHNRARRTYPRNRHGVTLPQIVERLADVHARLPPPVISNLCEESPRGERLRLRARNDVGLR